ncbi:MAG: YggS family pyridoxal phosphate-dependent enzyme [Bacteriovoracia bacterium]
MVEISAKYREVQKKVERAKSARLGSMPVVLIAVSKTRSADEIEVLYHLGHRDFGENYVQELVEKADELAARGCKDIRWHFIGHLQRNKVKVLLPHVAVIHAVDREELAQEISKRAQELGRAGVPVFIEVNVDEEPSKAGILPAVLSSEAAKIARVPGLQPMGIMCIPKAGEGAAGFKKLRKLSYTIRDFVGPDLSMGMSDDFEAAIAEGATHIRVGTAIFGPRA